MGKKKQKISDATSRIALIGLCTAFWLTGCVSNYTYFHDELEIPDPPLTEMCQYTWTIDEPSYRYEGLTLTHWNSALKHGIKNTTQPIYSHIENCTTPEQNRKPASATPYYLKYVDKFDRQLSILPGVAIGTLSAGIIPLTMTDYYAVCITITDANGKQRSAMATGHLIKSENLWEQVFPSEHVAARRRLEKERVLWSDLTKQAWQILWISDHPSNKLPGKCRDTLDTMAYFR